MIFSEATHRLLLSLFSIAYRTRTCLPLLISAGCMFLDFQVRLQINVNFAAQFPENQENPENEPEEAGEDGEEEEIEEVALEFIIATE